MRLLEIEEALISAIKAELPVFEVRAYPDKPSEYVLTHPKGAILVRYAGGRYEASEDIGAIVQARATNWELTVVRRQLRDHGGVYAVLDQLRIMLTGFRVPGCRKAYPVREEFISEKDGIWQYGLLLTVPTVNVERAEDEDLPVLRRLTLFDNLGGTEEIT